MGVREGWLLYRAHPHHPRIKYDQLLENLSVDLVSSLGKKASLGSSGHVYWDKNYHHLAENIGTNMFSFSYSPYPSYAQGGYSNGRMYKAIHSVQLRRVCIHNAAAGGYNFH